MTKRYALRDDQWEQIKDLLPGRMGTVGVTAKDNRLFVEAVLYRYRSGIRGKTYQNALVILESYIPVLAVGLKQVCGRESLKCCHMTVIMNTPC